MDISTLVDFAVFGLILNAVSVIPFMIVLMFRVAHLSHAEMSEYKNFAGMSRVYYAQNHQIRFILRFLLVFIPTYSVYINVVATYYLLRHEGSYGLIRSAIARETSSFVPLVQYKIVPMSAK